MDEGQPPAERPSAHLVVVARGELSIYASVRRNFLSATMEVVLDRRRGERRRAAAAVTNERRRGDRRRRDIAADLVRSGWALVRRDAGAASDPTRWSMAPGMEPARVRSETLWPVDSDADLIGVREQSRALAATVGLSATESASVAAAVSELARNLIAHATRGDVILRTIEGRRARGVEVVVVDEGPGIPDVQLALRERGSTSGGLGTGLPGVRRLMDELWIASRIGRGTTIAIRKWRGGA